MATPVDQLLVEIRAETADLRRQLKDVKKRLNETEKAGDGVNRAFKALGTIAASIGLGVVANDTVQTIRQFEDLEATLRAVTGSAEGAAASMNVIREFTKNTTFQIQEVTGAFIRLKLAGVVPTSDVMQDFGNLAAGMGKSIEDLALAAFNATTGEMEMLKQFGIRATLDGDKITTTFDGVTKTIERSGESIINFLRSVGREKFPTAVEERLNTLTGAVSNMKDAAAEFQVAIGDGGLRAVLTEFAKGLTETLNNSKELAHSLGAGLAVALQAVVLPIKLVVENMRVLVSLIAGAAVAQAIANFSSLVTIFMALQSAARKAAAAVAALVTIGTGGIGLAAVAAGTAAAAGVYLALGDAAEEAAEKQGGLKEANEELTRTVTATVDRVGNLKKEYADLMELLTDALPDDPKTLFDFGAEKAARDLDVMFRKFQKLRSEELYDEHPMVKLMRERGQENPVMPVSIDPTVTGNENLFREEFLKSLGLTEQQISDALGASVIGPITDSIKEIQGIVSDGEDDLLTKLLGDEAALRNVFNLAGGVEGLGVTFEELKRQMREAKAVAEAEFTDIGELIMDAFNESAPEDLEVLATATKEQVREAFNTAKLLGEIAENLDFETFFERYTKGLKDMKDAATDAIDPLKTLNTTIEALHGNETARNEVITSLNKAVADGVLTQDQANAAYREYLETLGPSDRAMASIAERVENMAGAFSNDLVNAIKNGESALDTFKNFAANIVTAVIQEFMRLMVIQPIVDAILGAFKMSLPDGNTTGGDVKVGGGPKSAGGGRVGMNVPTLVGERGPEIFVPQSHGNILNNMNSKRASGGGSGTTVVQNINFATGVQATVRQEVLGLMPRISEAAKAAVAESAQRGGQFRRSLQGG